jgi:hypothetical protein
MLFMRPAQRGRFGRVGGRANDGGDHDREPRVPQFADFKNVVIFSVSSPVRFARSRM